MSVEFEFFAMVKEVVGEKRGLREFHDRTTVREDFRSVRENHEPGGVVFNGKVHFRSQGNVLCNAERLGRSDGPVEALAGGDELSDATGVAGG